MSIWRLIGDVARRDRDDKRLAVATGIGPLAEALRSAISVEIPANWTAYAVEQLHLQIPHPAHWAIGVGEDWIMIRPSGGAAVFHNGQTFFNPGFTFRAGSGSNRDEALLSEAERQWRTPPGGIRVASLGRSVLHGVDAIAVTYEEDRPTGPWMTLLTTRVRGHVFVEFSVEGSPDQLQRLAPDLLAVLANLRWHMSERSFADAQSREFARAVHDTLPEGSAVGVVFEIEASNDTQYGRAFEAELTSRIDMRRLAGCELRVGDILPDCKYYCIRIDGDPEHIAFIRTTLGSVDNCAALPPAPYRFMSGTNLVRAPLVRRGVVDSSGVIR